MPEKTPIDMITVGTRATVSKTITATEAALYAAATGDFGPVHVDESYARTTRFGERIAPGIMVAGICTSTLASQITRGLGGVSIEDRFWFTGPVRYGDTVTIEVWVSAKNAEERTMIWEASAKNQEGLEVLRAWATVKFPRRIPQSG